MSQKEKEKDRDQAPKRQVLAAVDFSPDAEEALVQACRIASCLHAGVTVLHVVHDPTAMPGYYARIAKKKKNLLRMQDAAAEMLDAFMQAAAKARHQVQDMQALDTLLVAGLPVTRILEVADQLDAEMIILGSKGETGLRRLLVGSISEQVIRLSQRPVLIVKSPRK